MKNLRLNLIFGAAWALAAPAGLALQAEAVETLPLKLVATTPMPGFTGDFDHFGADLRGNRLFLAAELAKTVEIFDLKTGARTGSIPGFGHPLMMYYLAESNRLLVT